ncbi:hypothetical protein H0G72_04735, partial [Liberibacter sp. Z1]|nr:hypothetical protein [Candidatus Liberibacter sp.]
MTLSLLSPSIALSRMIPAASVVVLVFMATVNIVKVSSNYARQEKAILQS